MNRPLVIGGLLFLILFLSGCAQSVPSGYYDEFAQCLTDNGVVMYGAFWCNHCAKVKQNFGDSFQHVNYVECDPRGVGANPDLCLEKGVEAYSTFIFPNGQRLVGEPSMAQLSQASGCVLPPPLE